MTSAAASTGVEILAAVATVYFIFWAVMQLGFGVVAGMNLRRYLRRHTRRARALVDHVSSPLVSIIVPAYNEELTIVESIRALLALDYDACEIVVVNDGSSDGTLALLQQTFQLVPAPLAFVQPLPSKPVRAIYRSVTTDTLVVVDKENGGCKADASNAGINVASGTLVLVMDADTMIDSDALNQTVLSFLEDPLTIAVGAYVTIANGCAIEHGRVVQVGFPRSWLARFQVVEYMRAFLMFRLACTSGNALLILSGAFGVFRRDAVIAVGGFDRKAIGEDMDLTLRLHRHFREQGTPFRIAFTPASLCRTQAPEDWASLRAQRYRWRRGLLQVLWRNRSLVGNPRFGAVGLVMLPYMIVFEAFAPLLEIGTYIVVGLSMLAGLFDPRYSIQLAVIWLLLGTTVSFASIFLSDLATHEYMRGRDLARLVAAALVENLGYRQLNSLWSCVATMQVLTGRGGGWGPMRRRAFQGADGSPQSSA
jgi:cellulose synthase/poly-beta-1,6-N-acetylglucosamine synthase-like glycosyltransferase